MHAEFADALLLRLVPFRDNDAVATLLTPAQGLVPALARGARSSRKRFGGALDYLCLLRAELKPRRAGMAELAGVELLHAFDRVRGDLDRFHAASHFLEVARLGCREGDPAPEAFALLLSALDALEGGGDPQSLVRVFQARWVALAGYGLAAEACPGCGAPLSAEALVSFVDFAPACPRCLTRTRASERRHDLAPGAWKTLRAAESFPVERLGSLRIAKAILAELSPLLEDALAKVLGERPRSTGATPD